MLAQPPLWLILVAFLAAIGPLVFVHELGHYWMGRLFGVGAQSFSIGFGPELAGWTDRRGTRWKIGLIPLGGYVRFVGDADAVGRTDPAADAAPACGLSFGGRPVGQRFLIVLAGPIANFLLAIAIFAGFFGIYGMPRTANVVAVVQPASAAERAGIVPGDRIVAIDGRTVDSFEDIRRIVSLRPDQDLTVTVERGARRLALAAHTTTLEERDRFGQHFRVGLLGVGQTSTGLERLPLLELVPAALDYTIGLTGSMAEGLWQIVSGRRPVSELGGPMKMAQIAGQQASLGLFEFIQLIALFSINLGFINLLPVPMLDGGHLLFYSVEALRRRPVSDRAQEWAFRGGLAALLGLLVLTTLNDLGSFGLWNSLERLIG